MHLTLTKGEKVVQSMSDSFFECDQASHIDDTVLEQWSYEARKKKKEEEEGRTLTDEEFLNLGGTVQ